MFLTPFYSDDQALIKVSAEQGSRFAKTVCDDFNPLHNVDNTRFCVPGDLLFALTLQRFGLNREMHFTFTEMLAAGVALQTREKANTRTWEDGQGKVYMSIDHSGPATVFNPFVEALMRSYVRFSGQNFPHILMPLMSRHGVMINPQRPLVIYQSMSLDIAAPDADQLSTELTESSMRVLGRRGEVTLAFRFACGERYIGKGTKTMVLSGLRDYDSAAAQAMIERYLALQRAFSNPQSDGTLTRIGSGT